jgi:superoxide dismutase, Cu-Zn family
MRLPIAFLAATAALIGGCTADQQLASTAMPHGSVMAPLLKADGTAAGTATVVPVAGGRVAVSLTVMSMTPGKHGVHVHTTGACTPTFAAAGGHWNPAGAMHGLEHPSGQHAGDMPNVDVGADGTGSLTYTLAQGATLAGLLEGDGSAFVVHAGEDDQRTDPAGNSGDRVACGVFAVR